MAHTPLLTRRTFALAGGAALLAPTLLRAQSLERALSAGPVASTPVASPAATPALPPLIPNPDASWGWMLERGATATTLLSAGGPDRLVRVIAWNGAGQLESAGTRTDEGGTAVGDIIDRLRAGPPSTTGEITASPLWGAWRLDGVDPQGTPVVDNGTRAWDFSLAPLTAALVGERRRSQPLSLAGAGAVLCVFPHPGAPTTVDAAPGQAALAEILPALAFMTNPQAPLPIAGIPGIRQSWVQERGLGGMGTYRAQDGTPWAFWVLAP